MICNAELYPNYFSVNVSVLAVVFRRQISENRQFCAKLMSSFSEIYEKVSDHIHFLTTFENVYQISQKFVKKGHKRFGRFMEFPME